MELYANEISGKVVEVIRRGHTNVGNPKMTLVIELHTIEGLPVENVPVVTVRIRDNSGMVYYVENLAFKQETRTFKIDKRG